MKLTSIITIFILLSLSALSLSAFADDNNSWQAPTRKNSANPVVTDDSDSTGETVGISGLMGAVQIGRHLDVQPSYCYPPTKPDYSYSCFKDGYPKCCNKQKGNCLNGKVPACEVQPQPQPRSPIRKLTRKPTKKPSPPTLLGKSICTRSPDYQC
jgi:hypothetical protein